LDAINHDLLFDSPSKKSFIFHIDNNKKSDQHISMISEGSCDVTL